MKQFGVAAVFKFIDAGATSAMGRAGAKAGMLKASLAGIQNVGGKVAGALKSAALGAAGLAAKLGVLTGGLGIGAALSTFTDFEGQMGALKSVLGKEAEPAFAGLEAKARQLGETTQFSAKQASEAMENLARAGFSTNEIMAAIAPTLATAAAEGMDLATAADIISSNLRTFGLAASEAARVGDVLAYVSAKTATSIVELQEGMKFAAPVAKTLGISLEDTASTLGILSDVGLKASLGGTAFKSALLQMSAKAKGSSIPVGNLTAKIVKMKDGSVDVVSTMRSLMQTLAKIPSRTDRAAIAMKLLGLRGLGLPGAFEAAMSNSEKMAGLFGNLGEKAKGSAQAMAKMRLENTQGQLKLLKASLESVLISFGSVLTGSLSLGGGITGLTSGLGQLSKAFQFFQANPEMIDQTNVSIAGVGNTAASVAQAVMKGIENIKAFASTWAPAFAPALEGLSSLWDAVTAVVKAITLSDTPKEAWRTLGAVIGATISAAAEVVKFLAGLVENLSQSLKVLIGYLTNNAITRFVGGAAKGIGSAINAVAESKAANFLFDVFAPQPAAATAPVPAARDAMVSRGGMLKVSPGDVVLDRSALATGLMSSMRGSMVPTVAAGMSAGGDPGKTTPPPAPPRGGDIVVNVPVMVDGREVALAVARVKLSDLERGGGRLQPGERSAMLRRGAVSSF